MSLDPKVVGPCKPALCDMCRAIPMQSNSKVALALHEQETSLESFWRGISLKERGEAWNKISKATILQALRSKSRSLCHPCRASSQSFLKTAGAALRFIAALETEGQKSGLGPPDLPGYCDAAKFIFAGIDLRLDRKTNRFYLIDCPCHSASLLGKLFARRSKIITQRIAMVNRAAELCFDCETRRLVELIILSELEASLLITKNSPCPIGSAVTAAVIPPEWDKSLTRCKRRSKKCSKKHPHPLPKATIPMEVGEPITKLTVKLPRISPCYPVRASPFCEDESFPNTVGWRRAGKRSRPEGELDLSLSSSSLGSIVRSATSLPLQVQTPPFPSNEIVCSTSSTCEHCLAQLFSWRELFPPHLLFNPTRC